jgi:hypothetical protein
MFGRRERSTPYQTEPRTSLEDLRDDCVALFINSGLSMKQVHLNGGPTPSTISKWLYHETRFPRMDSIRALMQALGYDLVPMPILAAQSYREKHSLGNVTMFRPRKAARG